MQVLLPELAELDHDAVPEEGRSARTMAAWQGSPPLAMAWRRLLSATCGTAVIPGELLTSSLPCSLPCSVRAGFCALTSGLGTWSTRTVFSCRVNVIEASGWQAHCWLYFPVSKQVV